MEAAREYAEEINALFVETSAKEDTNVHELFVNISKRLPETAATSGSSLPDVADLSDPHARGKQGGCC